MLQAQQLSRHSKLLRFVGVLKSARQGLGARRRAGMVAHSARQRKGHCEASQEPLRRSIDRFFLGYAAVKAWLSPRLGAFSHVSYGHDQDRSSRTAGKPTNGG